MTLCWQVTKPLVTQQERQSGVIYFFSQFEKKNSISNAVLIDVFSMIPGTQLTNTLT